MSLIDWQHDIKDFEPRERPATARSMRITDGWLSKLWSLFGSYFNTAPSI